MTTVVRTVAVTGANGFVGRALCRRLQQDGLRVRAVVRRREAAALVPADEVAVVEGVNRPDAWVTALAGADAVAHLIALTHERAASTSALSEYRAVNVDITASVVAASQRVGVGRLLYVSSVKAVGEGAAVPYTEATPCHPVDAYGQTKREAEEVVQAGSDGVESVILRPPLVHGPGVRGNLLRLLRAVDKGRPLPVGAVRARRSLVGVDNLAAAASATLTHPAAAGELFFVTDGDAPQVRELVVALAELMQRRARLVPVPPSVLRATATLLRRGDLAERLVGDLVVDDRKIRTTLGWEPPLTLRDGLARTVAWYRSAVS